MSTYDTLTRVMQKYNSWEEPERLYALAGSYWRIMLGVGIVLCVAAVAGGVYMLVTTFFILTTPRSSTNALQSMNRKQLTQVVQGIGARKTYFQSLRESQLQIVDPSK